jgi:hypothetical protein
MGRRVGFVQRAMGTDVAAGDVAMCPLVSGEGLNHFHIEQTVRDKGQAPSAPAELLAPVKCNGPQKRHSQPQKRTDLASNASPSAIVPRPCPATRPALSTAQDLGRPSLAAPLSYW